MKKHICATFNKLQQKNPYCGAIQLLWMAVHGRKYSQETIARSFHKLVPKNDYDVKDKKIILAWLVSCSNTPLQTPENEGESPL